MSPRNAREWQGDRFYKWRGREMPSVTTILDDAWPNHKWRIPFGAKHTAERALSADGLERLGRYINTPSDDDATNDAEYDDLLKWLKAAATERRDAAGGQGTSLHEYLEDRLNGLAPADEPTQHERAIEQYLATYRPDPLYVEPQVISVSDGWGGSADHFATIYGRPLLVDLKTSPHADKDHKVRLQLAAYRHGDFIGEDDMEIAPVPFTEGGAVLYVPRDNPMGWQLIETPCGIEEYRVFLAAKRTWDMARATKDTGIGELLLPQVREDEVA